MSVKRGGGVPAGLWQDPEPLGGAEMGTAAAVESGAHRPGGYGLELANPTGEFVEWRWPSLDGLPFDEVIGVPNEPHTVRVMLWHDGEVLRLRIGMWETAT